MKKAVVYSPSGFINAQSLYLKELPDSAGNSDIIRIITQRQEYNNIHLYIPNLKNCDGHGGRKKVK